MISAIFTVGLALAGMTNAAVIGRSQYPATKVARGYKLVFNVTETGSDFPATPVHGLQLTGVHAGAGLNAPTVFTAGGGFFTTTNNTVQMAIGGPTPYGIFMSENPSDGTETYGLGLNAGWGSKGLTVASVLQSSAKCPALSSSTPGTFAVCDTGFAAPTHPQLLVVYVGDGLDKVPTNCVAVKLLPECADVDGQLDQATYPVDNLVESFCYEDVSAIDWSTYSSCE